MIAGRGGYVPAVLSLILAIGALALAGRWVTHAAAAAGVPPAVAAALAAVI